MLSPLSLVVALTLVADEPKPEVIRLWPGKAPGQLGDTEKDIPTITAYRPAKPNGAAVVVCPGGGYGHLAVGHEGLDIARWLNERGGTAFVLRYRIAPKYHEPTPMLDAQRAIRTVRENAERFGIDPKRVGVWGFSAGGHLASTVGTHFDNGKFGSSDSVELQSSRPDLLILAYPVIDMEPPVTHGGSRRNLLGTEPDPKKVAFYRNHKHVTKEPPPTFLFHTADDKAVPVDHGDTVEGGIQHGPEQFLDRPTLDLNREFERAVYESLDEPGT